MSPVINKTLRTLKKRILSTDRIKDFDMTECFYVYVLLDPRYPGDWEIKYKGQIIGYLPAKPFYVGKGKRGTLIQARARSVKD